MRNISLDIIRVTEAGAIAASDLIGCGSDSTTRIDQTATEAIKDRLQQNRLHSPNSYKTN